MTCSALAVEKILDSYELKQRILMLRRTAEEAGLSVTDSQILESAVTSLIPPPDNDCQTLEKQTKQWRYQRQIRRLSRNMRST
jgi:hypothetical protein